MRRFYIKTFIKIVIPAIVLCFLNVQSAYCATGNAGIDINQFKKIKNVKTIFKKEKKKSKKDLKMEKLNLPPTDGTIFDYEDDEMDKLVKDAELQDIEDEKAAKKAKKQKKEKVKKEKSGRRFLFFKRKSAKTDVLEEQEEEITKDDARTYINDSDIVNIKEVEIYGNNLLEANYIKEQMASREGEQYVRSEVSNDLKALYATGYFTKNIRALPIKMDENNIKLRVIVEENPPVHGFVIIGNNSISTADIMAILAPFERQPQNILSLNNAISEIQELYSSRGYVVARVTKIADDPDGYIYIYIDEGIIGDIIVEGNNKTKDFIVKRNIFLQPGCVYNENVMRSDILRLMGTQAFSDVQREIVQDETTGLYDVYIMLEEQRTGRISVGVGIDSASGFFGSVGFSENNFRGLGQKLNLNLMAGTGILMEDSSIVRKPTFQGEISFLEPMFKRENQSLAIRGFGRYYGSYQVPLAIERRIGGEVTLARKFIAFKNLSGSISLGAEHVHLEEGNLGKIRSAYNKAGVPFSRRNEEMEGGMYVKLTPALTYDTRDTSLNPRHGLLARISFEENIGINAKTFGKLTGSIRKFLPLGKKSSIVLTGKAGGKIHGNIPEWGGYSLGGPYTIRGFNISEVGVGSGYMMGSAEVRIPIPFIDRLTSNSFLNNLRIAGFVDAGTLFSDSIGSKIYRKPGYAISAGVGLRIFIPGLGPINLDYGIPLTNTAGVNRSNGFFTFGMGELY